MKQRLIDADALKNLAEEVAYFKMIDLDVLKIMIDHAPTIDAVPVVRCKDCKHRYITGSTTHYYVCDFMDAEYNANGYCHHVERRDDETN